MAKEKSLQYMTLYWADLLTSGTWIMMSAAAKGIYIELLGCAWLAGGLPSSVAEIKRHSKATDQEWRQFEPFLEDVFPLDDDGRRKNPRQERERIRARDFSASQSKKGKASAETRKNNQPKHQPNYQPDEQLEVQPDDAPTNEPKDLPSTEPNYQPNYQPEVQPEGQPKNSLLITHNSYTHNSELTSPQSPQGGSTPADGESDDRPSGKSFHDFFAEFKARYPRRSGGYSWSIAEGKLKKVWRSDGDAILAGVDRYRQHLEQTAKIGTEYVKQASTWVNQRGWLDEIGGSGEPTVPIQSQASAHGGVASDKPIQGVDYRLTWDPSTDQAVTLDLVTGEPFDEAIWRARRSA